MKLVTAIINNHQLDRVKGALESYSGPDLSVSETRVRLARETRTYRGATYEVDLFPRVRLEVLCDLFDAEDVAEVIVSASRIALGGGEKVWISDVDRVLTIPVGEAGLMPWT